MSFGRLGDYLESGLLADRTLNIITKNRKLDDNDQPVIIRSIKFIDNIIQGRKQVNSGRLQNNAIISVNAYTTTMLAISYSDTKTSRDIEKYLNIIKLELEGIIKSERIISDNLKNSIAFFKMIKSYNAKKVSDTLYNKNEENEWLIQIK